MENADFIFKEKALEIIRNKTALVICGGGVLGTALLGSLGKLVDLGMPLNKIKSITGSSVGSIIGTAIAAGASYSYINNKVNSLNFTEFVDRSCILVQGARLIKNYGLHKTDKISEFISEILSELLGNADITFKDLYDLTGTHLTVTYLSLNYEKTMYADYINEPNSLVREAVVKSCSIPVFFEANFEKKEGLTFVDIDGGTQNNYPMNVPRNQQIDPINIIGLKLISPKDMTDSENGGNDPLINFGPPRNVIDYLKRVISILREQAMRIHVSDNDWMLTVKINIEKYTSTDFNLTEKDKITLAGFGQDAVTSYVNELTNLLKTQKFPY